MGLVIVIFVVVLLTTAGFAMLLTRSLHQRDVTQIKDRLTGRIRLPKKLIEHAGLGEGPCTIVGNDDWFEIWNAEDWRKYEQGMEAEVSDVAEGISHENGG